MAPVQHSLLRKHVWLLLGAAILNVPGITHVAYIPALLSAACLALLVQHAATPRAAMAVGTAFVVLSASMLNYWMVPTLLHYTGGNWPIAIGCYLASWILLAPFFAVQFGFFAWLRRRNGGLRREIFNALLFAGTWVLMEWGRAWLFSAVPWMAFSWGSALGGNTLLVQPAAFGGIFALTFLLALPAYLFAAAWRLKKRMPAYCAAAAIVLQLLGGWVAWQRQETAAAQRPSFRVALVQPALPAGALWDRQQINGIVQNLLQLNRQAASLHADLNIWTETIVPWTYRKDDDFVQTLLEPYKGSGTHTLLGMTTEPEAGVGDERTSVYVLNASGSVLGRYDKQELLAGAERPFFGGFALPFQSGNATRFVPGRAAPVPTPWGAAGLLLCNESTIPAPARRAADAGATWLAVVGNDAWFADTYVALGHFYQCRIRAVENRKDVVVNINAARAGVIRASGSITGRFEGFEAAVHAATVQPNPDHPPSHLFFNLFVVLVMCTTHRFSINRKTKKQ